MQLSLDGQSISGNFQVTQGTIGTNTSVTEIAASNVSATFGDGSGGGVTLSNGSGLFVLGEHRVLRTDRRQRDPVGAGRPGAGHAQRPDQHGGRGQRHDPFGTLTSSAGTQSVVLGDVNGDGLPDLIMSTTGGQLLEYLNDGQLAPFDGVTPITIRTPAPGAATWPASHLPHSCPAARST